MRVILCDVCERKIVNSPVVKMQISYEYPEESTPTKDHMFVAVSGMTVTGYNSYYTRTRDGHKLEMCLQCAQYVDHSLRNRQEQIKKNPPQPEPVRILPEKEVIDAPEQIYDNIAV